MPEFVDITPHVSLLAKVGQSGHSVSDAVAELVDNALDARPARRAVRVEVELDMHQGLLRVRDDGGGMTGAELGRALVLAESNKNGTAIGRFGLGLKTACASLGSRFEITSAVKSGHYAHVACYDADAFLADGAWRLPVRRVRKPWPQGTLVEIHSKRLYPALLSSLPRNLGWTFRHFLLDSLLRLSLNGQPVEAVEHDVDPDTVILLEGEVGGHLVRGWAGLLRKSSQRGWYGFALVRHRRVVRRHEKLGFQAHPQTARVVGELHLDAFDTNNLKTDFIRETESWRELEQWVGEAIEPVLAASRKLAHAGMLDLKVRAEIDARRGRLGAETEDLHLPLGVLDADDAVSEPVTVVVDTLHLKHVFSVLGPDDPYVEVEDIVREGEVDLLVVRTNLAHTAATQVTDRSGWACHNLAEAAASRLSRGDDQLQLKSVILSKLLEEQPLRRALQASARGLVRAPAMA
jgi:hypothetical protein